MVKKLKAKVFKISVSSILFLLLLSYPAMSYSPFLDQARDFYNNNNLSCEMCHIGATMNIYGNDFANALENNHNIIIESFKDIEETDSDGDGFSNKDEIKVSTNPGDAFIFPKKETLLKSH